jgi:hypothetical protein
MTATPALKPSQPTDQELRQTVEDKIHKLRELFTGAPELGKKALENAIAELKSQASDLPPPVESAGRVGARLDKVSELTIIVPLAPGGAQRLRAFLRLLGGEPLPGREQGRHSPHYALRVLR